MPPVVATSIEVRVASIGLWFFINNHDTLLNVHRGNLTVKQAVKHINKKKIYDVEILEKKIIKGYNIFKDHDLDNIRVTLKKLTGGVK